MNISNIKHLVLSGGGLLGISYIGLFKYLEEHNVNCQIQTITGCSAGAIFGAFLAVGYTGEELDKITKGLCFKDYLNITAESIINFMRLKGLESGKKLMSLIKKIIKDKTNDENITFSQIQARFNITLKIGVTNLTTSKFELLSYINMPNLPIYQAINASIAIPFIFEPVVINNNIYVDGGLLDNLPIEQILNFEANANANVNGLKENAIDNSPVNT
jgi:NTE family protein